MLAYLEEILRGARLSQYLKVCISYELALIYSLCVISVSLYDCPRS
jgi:hypothetical protein